MPDAHPPSFDVSVAGQELPLGVTQYVSQAVVESADGLADVVKLSFDDPRAELVDAKFLQEGNELDVWGGYGARLAHLGRYVIARSHPSFPADGVPTIEVVGYTADFKMMDNEPAEGRQRIFRDYTVDDVVFQKCNEYGWLSDVDEVKWPRRDYIQKGGMTDYDFVRGLANMVGYLFWVDGNERGEWTLHFRDPALLFDGGSYGSAESIQEKKYTLRYNDGDHSTLLSFEPQYAISGARTKLKAVSVDTETGATFATEFEDNENAIDLAYSGDPREKILQAPGTASAVKLYFGEFSFELVSDKRFKSAAELEAWAAQWFRRNKDAFIIGTGTTIGVETMRARQIHTLEGVGRRFSGDYQMSVVRHMFSRDGGFSTEFTGRKVVS